ncbi:MAG: hypothetical protein HEQ19_17620 [Gloeotrichia echinulata CP02]
MGIGDWGLGIGEEVLKFISQLKTYAVLGVKRATLENISRNPQIPIPQISTV